MSSPRRRASRAATCCSVRPRARPDAAARRRQITSNLKNTVTGLKGIIGKKFHSEDIEIERKLVQPDLTSEGDSLNYREQLWEKLQQLIPIVASADTRPTTQSYAVFEKISGEMDPHLSVLDELIAGDLAALNDSIEALDVDTVGS